MEPKTIGQVQRRIVIGAGLCIAAFALVGLRLGPGGVDAHPGQVEAGMVDADRGVALREPRGVRDAHAQAGVVGIELSIRDRLGAEPVERVQIERR